MLKVVSSCLEVSIIHRDASPRQLRKKNINMLKLSWIKIQILTSATLKRLLCHTRNFSSQPQENKQSQQLRKDYIRRPERTFTHLAIMPPVPAWARFWICGNCKKAKMTLREDYCTHDGKLRDLYAIYTK